MVEQMALTVINPLLAKCIVFITTLMGIIKYLGKDDYLITIEERNMNALLSFMGGVFLMLFPSSVLESLAEWSIYSILSFWDMPELPLMVYFLVWSSTIIYATILELGVMISLRIVKRFHIYWF